MIYIITGQTATGKTRRALELARKVDGELINCDSRQIYKTLNIITGKDLALTTRTYTVWKNAHSFDIGYYELLQGGRLWLYDIVNPNQPFSAFDYRILATETINHLQMEGKTPIIIGGTYFYLKHLLYDILDSPVPPNVQLREKLALESTSTLQQILSAENPSMYNDLNNSEKHNRQRLIRKIEVVRAGNTTSSNTNIEYELAPPFTPQTTTMEGYHFIDRRKQYTIIKQRVQARLEEGAIAEVESLPKSGYTGTEPGLQTIGYQQIIKYLHKELSLEDMKKEWLTREMQYAKRQYTFAKQDPNITWIEV